MTEPLETVPVLLGNPSFQALHARDSPACAKAVIVKRLTEIMLKEGILENKVFSFTDFIRFPSIRNDRFGNRQKQSVRFFIRASVECMPRKAKRCRFLVTKCNDIQYLLSVDIDEPKSPFPPRSLHNLVISQWSRLGACVIRHAENQNA